MSDLKVISELQDEIIELEVKSQGLKNAQKALQEILNEKERKMIALMTEAKLTNFRTPSGQIILNRRFTVTTPKGDDLKTFIGALDPDTKEALLNVNHATLNAWYKIEMEKAKERGDFEWCPAGLKPPTVNEYLSVKK